MRGPGDDLLERVLHEDQLRQRARARHARDHEDRRAREPAQERHGGGDRCDRPSGQPESRNASLPEVGGDPRGDDTDEEHGTGRRERRPAEHQGRTRQREREDVYGESSSEGHEPAADPRDGHDEAADDDRSDDERECHALGAQERDRPGGSGKLRRGVLDEDEVTDGEDGEDKARAGRERVPADDRDPCERHRFGRPRDRNRRTGELDRYCHRQGGDAGRRHDEAERMAIPVPGKEQQAQREVGHGGQRDEDPAPGLLRAVEHGEARPEGERGVREQERHRRGPQAAGRVSRLFATRRHDVHEPEAKDDGDAFGSRWTARRVDGHLRRREHEGKRRQPDPRPEERDGGRADECGRDEEQGHERRRGAEQRRRGKDRHEPERRDELGVVANRDDGGGDGGDERAKEAQLHGNEAVQPGRRDQGQ